MGQIYVTFFNLLLYSRTTLRRMSSVKRYRLKAEDSASRLEGGGPLRLKSTPFEAQQSPSTLRHAQDFQQALDKKAEGFKIRV